MRLNVDGLNDLVILRAGDPQPAVALTAPVHTFVINTADASSSSGDINPGDGICRDFNGNCSLGAAIGEANASPGADLITFNIAPGGPQTIRFDSLFGAILNPVFDFTESATLDATTQPGFAGTPIISFTGSLARLGCLQFSGSVVIRGIAQSGNQSYDPINGRGGNGFEIFSDNNIIEGNFIQSNQGAGILVTGSNNLVGGTTAASRNVISGNGFGSLSGFGFFAGVRSQNGNSNQIQGNSIGTDLAGMASLPNFGGGIYIPSGHNNGVGGALPGAGNRIAFNYGHGVEIGHPVITPSPSNILVSRNAIYSNTLFGINLVKIDDDGSTENDLKNDGLTENDLGDADTGANGLQNFPTITSVASSGGSTTIQGTLNSRPNTTYQLEFFANDAVTSFQYEGQELIGTTSVTTDGTGNATFTSTVPVAVSSTRFISATATDPTGNTSEFSFALQVNTAGNSQPPVIAVIYFNPPKALAPANVAFYGGLLSTDLDGTIVSYAWNFGDNTTGSGSIVSHTYPTAGNYPVTLTVTDNAGNTASTSVVAIVLASTTPPPDPNIIPAPSNLTATATSRRVTVRWQDNSTNETNFVVERAPKSSGRFIQTTSLAVNTTTFSQTLAPGTYLYRVRAYNRTTKKYSAYSNTAEVRVG
ncbi:MAG: PKD domain-containing protein [Acidobacteria bacterium]|nr:PKD domain-containing protein [Acidobacteriota bacterium]